MEMECNLAAFFLDTNYSVDTFEYEDITQKYYVLDGGAVDPDLTGQHLWHAAPVLCKYMIQNREEFEGKRVIELGGGTGICGLVCSHFAKHTVITDYKDVVLDLIKKNILEHSINSVDHQTSYAKIDWQNTDYDSIYVNSIKNVSEEASISIQDFGDFDIVIGSDLLQFVFVPPILIGFLDKLFNYHKNKLVFYMAYVERYFKIHEGLKEQLELYKFTYESIARDLCEDCKEKCFLYKITRLNN